MNEDDKEYADKQIDESLEHGKWFAQQLVERLKGNGGLTIGTIGVTLAYFESQHKGTIEDVVKVARLLSAIHEANMSLDGITKASGQKPN
jgi:hypothetical protein